MYLLYTCILAEWVHLAINHSQCLSQPKHPPWWLVHPTVGRSLHEVRHPNRLGFEFFHHAGTVESLRIFREAEVWSISSVSEDAPKKWSKSGDKKNWGAVSQNIVTYSCIDFRKKMSSLANLVTIKISTCGLLNLLGTGGLLSDFFGNREIGSKETCLIYNRCTSIHTTWELYHVYTINKRFIAYGVWCMCK